MKSEILAYLKNIENRREAKIGSAPMDVDALAAAASQMQASLASLAEGKGKSQDGGKGNSLLLPPSSQVRLRPVVALWHAVSVAYLAAALAPHSHSLTVLLSLSSLSSLSHLSFLSLSLSFSLSFSLLSVSRLSVSLLFLLS